MASWLLLISIDIAYANREEQSTEKAINYCYESGEKLIQFSETSIAYPANEEKDIFGDIQREEIDNILTRLYKYGILSNDNLVYPKHAEKIIFADLSQGEIDTLMFNILT